MKNIFTGLKAVLKKFDENGKYAKWGSWSIANGGYDLWWEIYYDGNTVLQCVDGTLEGGFSFEYETELINRVKQIYTDVK